MKGNTALFLYITIVILLNIIIADSIYGYSTYGAPSEFGNLTTTTCWIGGDDGIINCTGEARFGSIIADVIGTSNASDFWDNLDSPTDMSIYFKKDLYNKSENEAILTANISAANTSLKNYCDLLNGTWNASVWFNYTIDDEWITPAQVLDIDKEDIESDLNTFVDIAGDIMTGGLQTTDLNITNLANCDTIDTDANGVLSCGSDEGTEGCISDLIWIEIGKNNFIFYEDGGRTFNQTGEIRYHNDSDCLNSSWWNTTCSAQYDDDGQIADGNMSIDVITDSSAKFGFNGSMKEMTFQASYYDDGETAGVPYSIFQLCADLTCTNRIGYLGYLEAQNVNTYSYFDGTSWHDTGISRSIKWHNLTYYVSGISVSTWIDGTLAYNETSDSQSVQSIRFWSEAQTGAYWDEILIWQGLPEDRPILGDSGTKIWIIGNETEDNRIATISEDGILNASDFLDNGININTIYFDNLEDFTGTLTNTKYCTYNSANGEIDCNSEGAGSDSDKWLINNSVFRNESGTLGLNISLSSYLLTSDYTTNITAINLSIKNYIDTQDSAQDECSEITNCVPSAWDADADISNNEIGEAKIAFSTACASGSHYYLNGNDLACEADTGADGNAKTLCGDSTVLLGQDATTCWTIDSTTECAASSVCGGGHTHSDIYFTETESNTNFVSRNAWTDIDSYPATCAAATPFIGTIGDTSTCRGVVSDTSPQLGGYLDTQGQNIGSTADEIENIYIGVNTKIYLGDGQEGEVYYDGSKLVIKVN